MIEPGASLELGPNAELRTGRGMLLGGPILGSGRLSIGGGAHTLVVEAGLSLPRVRVLDGFGGTTTLRLIARRSSTSLVIDEIELGDRDLELYLNAVLRSSKSSDSPGTIFVPGDLVVDGDVDLNHLPLANDDFDLVVQSGTATLPSDGVSVADVEVFMYGGELISSAPVATELFSGLRHGQRRGGGETLAVRGRRTQRYTRASAPPSAPCVSRRSSCRTR